MIKILRIKMNLMKKKINTEDNNYEFNSEKINTEDNCENDDENNIDSNTSNK